MELDKRIKTITDILTVVNSDLKGIIGKTGYFGNSIMDFKRLDTCEYGELTGIIRNTDRCFEYKNCAESGRQGYCYFIPEYYLNPEEPEKKYREYKDLDEFLDVTGLEIGDLIHLKFPGGNDAQLLIVGGCDNGLFIGIHKYTFKQLFEMVEISISGEWQPFGVIEDE